MILAIAAGSSPGSWVAHPDGRFPRYIHLRFAQQDIFVLAVLHGRVDSIGYLGPHTVCYEGLC